MRWLHFSDIHFNFDGYDTTCMRETLLDYLKDLNIDNIDVLFITGDFRFAPKREFKTDTKDYIENMRKSIGIMDKPFYITAGNHDLNRNETRKNFIESFRKRYDASKGELSLEDLKHLNIEFEDFNNFISDAAGEIINSNNPHRFIRHNEANIICINTSITSGMKSGDEYGQLILGIKFLEECFKKIDLGKPTIVYGHHSLESLRYDEQVRVIELFQKYNVHVYLCGHNHVFQINNISYNEKHKLYEVFSGNLYTENRYSQCGFLEANLSNNVLEIKCHEWDFNARKWHLSNTYSDNNNESVKILELYDFSSHRRFEAAVSKKQRLLLDVMMISDGKVALTVPVYEKKFYNKKWPIVHFNEFEYTIKIINSISTDNLKVETTGTTCLPTYQFSEIHIGGPTVNSDTYQYIINFLPTYKSIVKRTNIPKESKFVSPGFIQEGEKTGFSIVDQNGKTHEYFREDKRNDIGILIRLKINERKTVHLIFGTGKRGTLAALNYLTNYAEDIMKNFKRKNYFLLLWGNYTNYSIDFSKGITDLSHFLKIDEDKL